MVDNTIDTFAGWNEIVDYESDETTVILINTKGEKVVEFGYSRFTREDYNRYKNKFCDWWLHNTQVEADGRCHKCEGTEMIINCIV